MILQHNCNYNRNALLIDSIVAIGRLSVQFIIFTSARNLLDIRIHRSAQTRHSDSIFCSFNRLYSRNLLLSFRRTPNVISRADEAEISRTSVVDPRRFTVGGMGGGRRRKASWGSIMTGPIAPRENTAQSRVNSLSVTRRQSASPDNPPRPYATRESAASLGRRTGG